MTTNRMRKAVKKRTDVKPPKKTATSDLQKVEEACRLLYHPETVSSGLEKLRTLAEKKGTINAMLRLGNIYQRGWGKIKRDIGQAKKWYQLAAHTGSKKAREILDRINNPVEAKPFSAAPLQPVPAKRDSMLAAAMAETKTPSAPVARVPQSVVSVPKIETETKISPAVFKDEDAGSSSSVNSKFSLSDPDFLNTLRLGFDLRILFSEAPAVFVERGTSLFERELFGWRHLERSATPTVPPGFSLFDRSSQVSLERKTAALAKRGNGHS